MLCTDEQQTKYLLERRDKISRDFFYITDILIDILVTNCFICI